MSLSGQEPVNLRKAETPLASNAEKTAAEAVEAKRRQQEQEQFNHHCEAFANYYRQTTGHAGVWAKVTATDDEGRLLGRSEELASLFSDTSKLLTDGRYKSNSTKRVFDFDIQDGKVTPIIPHTAMDQFRFNKDKFKDVYGEMMDVLAAGKGKRKVTIDWPSNESGASYVTESRLDILIALAQEKKIEIEFGPNVQAFINSRQPAESGLNFKEWFGGKYEIDTQASRKRINKYAEALVTTASIAHEFISNPEYKKNEEGFFIDKDQGSLKANSKFEKEKAIDEMEKITDPAKKLDKIAQQLEMDDKRVQRLERMVNEQTNQADAYTSAIKAATSEERLPESDFNQGKREDLLSAMEQEKTDLKERSEFWQSQLSSIQSTAASDPAELAAIKAKLDACVQQQSELAKKSAGLNIEGVKAKINEWPNLIKEQKEKIHLNETPQLGSRQP